MLEVGKGYEITMTEIEVGEGEVQTVYPNCRILDIQWPVARVDTGIGQEMFINLSSPNFVKAVPRPR